MTAGAPTPASAPTLFSPSYPSYPFVCCKSATAAPFVSSVACAVSSSSSSTTIAVLFSSTVVTPTGGSLLRSGTEIVTGPPLVSSSAAGVYSSPEGDEPPFFSSSSGEVDCVLLLAAWGLGGKSNRDIILFIFFRYVKSISQMQP